MPERRLRKQSPLPFSGVFGDLSHAAPTAPLSALIDAWLAGDVTTLETGRRIDRQHRQLDDLPSPARDALMRLFPPYPGDDPDRAVVGLLVCALSTPGFAGDVLTAVAGRRALLEAVITLEPGDAVADIILRPGERVMLGTTRGRQALTDLLEGNPQPLVDWLDRTVLDEDAFASTTSDVPLHDLKNLRDLITRLSQATEALPPGSARVMVADEWVAETTVAALGDDVPFADVARAIGETLLEQSSPILLWHAAHELALVAEDDPELRDAVLRRCLVMADCEAGRCPAEAAAPLLAELGTRGASRTLDALGPDLTSGSWRAINKKYLRRELADHWHDWRDDIQRWATSGNPNRALAAFDALLRAPAPETGAIAWFVASVDPDIRATCRSRLGLEV